MLNYRIWFRPLALTLVSNCRATIGLAAIGLTTLTSCVTWPELEPKLDVQWRGRSVFDGGTAYILATSSGAAADVRERLATILSEIGKADARGMTKGLVIAIDSDDAPLIQDPKSALETLSLWHQSAIGSTKKAPMRIHVGEGAKIDLAVIARAMPAAVPLQSDPLQLPELLRNETRWVAILPTTDAVETCCDAMFDVGLAKLSFLQRLLAAPLLFFMSGSIVEQFELELRPRIYEACLVGLEVTPDRRAQILRWLNEKNDLRKRESLEALRGKAEQFEETHESNKTKPPAKKR